MSHQNSPRSIWLSAGFVAVFNALLAIWIIWRPASPAVVLPVIEYAEILGPLLMAGMCWHVVSQPWRGQMTRKGPRNQIPPWVTPLLFGLGVFSFALGQGIWTFYELVLHQPTPFPSLADVAYLGEYPFLIAGLLLLPMQRLRPDSRLRVSLDSLMVLASIITFSWYFILGPTLQQQGEAVIAKLIGTAYPLMDIFLLSCMLLLFARARQRSLQPAILTLTVAIAFVTLADSIFDVQTLQGTYNSGSLLSVAWTMGYMLFGVAAQQVRWGLAHPRAVAPALAPAATSKHTSPFALLFAVLPYTLVPAVGALLVYSRFFTQGETHLEVGVYVGGVILITFVFLRQVFAIRETIAYAKKVRELNLQLNSLATTDPLTGLPNHRALVAALDQEMQRAQSSKQPLSLLFFDLDHFKALNDSYGHPAGDLVLRESAQLLQSLLRPIDTIGRWGGEEFVALLPGVDSAAATAAADRLCERLGEYLFPLAGGVHITCSLGVASYPRDASSRDALFEAADRAMYAAKHLGRNQVCCVADPLVAEIHLASETSSREEIAMMGMVTALTEMVGGRDSYTGNHTASVGKLVLRMALALDLDIWEARMIEIAGTLHDIGKIAVPDAILHKPAQLSEEEWEVMRTHPEVGAQIISHIPALRGLSPLIRAHHERWDGTGYPDRLVGEAIPLGARIISVVDTYEAITTTRPYRQAQDSASALREIRRCAGTQFDPSLVDVLERVLALAAYTHEQAAQAA